MIVNNPKAVVPDYSVEVAEHIRQGILQWTGMQRQGFLREVEALGYCARTRSVREYGGRFLWMPFGDFHVTFVADSATRVLMVTAARPCTHAEGSCFS